MELVTIAKALAIGLRKLGFTLVTGGTDNHMILIDLTSKNITGMKAERALEKVGIITNKNMIPGDLRSPFDPSGLRLGTSVLTSRGMGEREMAEVSMMIAKVVDKPSSPAVLSAVKKEVQVLTRKFPVK